MIAGDQPSTQDRGLAQETQMRGFWIDPSTGLMWAGKDNGKDVSWNKAIKYCRDLRLAGYSDWRLANMVELQGLFDRTANSPGRDGHGASTWHIKGSVFLTGYQWANSQRDDLHWYNSAYEWYFDFNEGRWNNQASGFPYSSSFMRGVCVRGSAK
jgi:hypothetical protein